MRSPNTFESIAPCSGSYSFRRDLRLNAWLLVATVVYLVQRYVLHLHPDWAPLPRALIGLTPLVPALFYLRDWVRFIRGMDELQRRIQREAHIFAAWGTLLLGIVLTTLHQHGLVDILPHGLGFGGVLVSVMCLWLIGVAIANCRYK